MARWEVKMYHDKTHVENQLSNGHKYLVNKKNPRSIDVDDDLSTYLYDLADNLGIDSLFHVGYGFGHDLINLHLLYPDMKLGGCELFDLRRAYGHQLFGLKDYPIDIIPKEYPYFDIEDYDYIFIGQLLRKSHVGTEVYLKAIQQANCGVIMFVDTNLIEAFEVPEGYIWSTDKEIGGVTPVIVMRNDIEWEAGTTVTEVVDLVDIVGSQHDNPILQPEDLNWVEKTGATPVNTSKMDLLNLDDDDDDVDDYINTKAPKNWMDEDQEDE